MVSSEPRTATVFLILEIRTTNGNNIMARQRISIQRTSKPPIFVPGTIPGVSSSNHLSRTSLNINAPCCTPHRLEKTIPSVHSAAAVHNDTLRRNLSAWCRGRSLPLYPALGLRAVSPILSDYNPVLLTGGAVP